MFGRPKIFTGSLSYLMPIIRHYCDIIEIFFISQFSESICNIGLKIIPLQPKLLIHNKDNDYYVGGFLCVKSSNVLFVGNTTQERCGQAFTIMISQTMP